MNKTKALILETMYKLLAEKGYDKSSIGQICEIIGIKKPSVYYYFKSKEEILIALLEGIVDGGFAHAEKEGAKSDYTPEEYKQDFVDEFIQVIEKYENDVEYCKVSMEIYIQSNRIEKVQEIQIRYSESIQAYFRDKLKLGVELGVFNKTFDLDANVQLLHNSIQGIESAIVFNLPIDSKRVWALTVNRMFESNC